MFAAHNPFLSTARSCNFLFHNTEVIRVVQFICLLVKLLKGKKIQCFSSSFVAQDSKTIAKKGFDFSMFPKWDFERCIN